MAFRFWRALAKSSPVLPAGWLVDRATVHKVPKTVRAGYDAPSRTRATEAGARLPAIGTLPRRPIRRSRPTGRRGMLGHWEKPVLCVFGARDPILGNADQPLIRHPRRRGTAARPDRGRPFHPGGRRAGTGSSAAGLGGRSVGKMES